MTHVRMSRLFLVALATLIWAAPVLAHGWPAPAITATSPAVGTTGGRTGGGSEARGGTPGVPQTGASLAGRIGGTTSAKPKGGSTPWLAEIRVPWTPAFLPAIKTGEYAARAGTIAEAIKLSPADGGWTRDARPIMVFAYDATNPEHRRIMAKLDEDGRVRTASYFFNCFRVDVGAFSDKAAAKDAHLLVYTADGTLIGDIAAQRKLSAAYDLLESAWKKQTGSELSDRVAKMDGLLQTRAHSDHFLPKCEAGIVCPDCGHERLDIVERIAELKARTEACDRAMAELRTVAKN